MAKDPAERYESAQSLRLRSARTPAGTRRAGSGVAPGVHGFVNAERQPAVCSGSRHSIAAAVVPTLLAAWFAPGVFRGGRHVPPPEAVVWYNRGTSAIREGAYFQASRALERALEIDNAFALAHARRSEAYAEIELTDRAREELLQAMALLPDRSNLSDAESMYLDAVAATLNRDFKTAIEKYSHIVDSVRDEEKSAAYVDLGRAYEKDENLDQPLNRT